MRRGFIVTRKEALRLKRHIGHLVSLAREPFYIFQAIKERHCHDFCLFALFSGQNQPLSIPVDFAQIRLNFRRKIPQIVASPVPVGPSTPLSYNHLSSSGLSSLRYNLHPFSPRLGENSASTQ